MLRNYVNIKRGSKSSFGRFDKWMGRVLKRKKT
jgi:hypothetical protein